MKSIKVSQEIVIYKSAHNMQTCIKSSACAIHIELGCTLSKFLSLIWLNPLAYIALHADLILVLVTSTSNRIVSN